MGDDYLAVKVKPELTDEDMKAFADQLSSLMANFSIDVNAVSGTTTDSNGNTTSGAGATITDVSPEAQKKLAEAQVEKERIMATGGGQAILSKLQEPQTDATKSMKEQLGSALEGTMELCNGIFSGVTAIFTLAKKATEGPLNTVLGIMEKLFNLVFLPLNIALTMALIPVVKSMATTIGRFVQSALKMYEEKGLAGIIEATFSTLWEVFLPILGTLWDTFTAIFPKMWQTLFASGGFGTALAILIVAIPGITAMMLVTKIWELYVSTKLLEIWTCEMVQMTNGGLIALAVGLIVTAITLIVLNWDTIKKWCEDIWTKFIDFEKQVLNFYKTIGETIWNAISQLYTKIWEGISSAIPHFASGGIVGANSPQLALIGDNANEPEVVAPYSTIVSAVGTALNNNTQLTTNNSKSNGQVINNYFNITGTNADQIADETMRLMDKSVTKSTSKWGM